jgi:hypothetical protein
MHHDGRALLKKLALALILAFVAAPHSAKAQGWSQNPYGGGYTVTTPGQPPTFVNPNAYGGGYTATTPGGPTTFINPNPYGGGYTVTTPGQQPTFINPNPYAR